jgi:hypothetical protein
LGFDVVGQFFMLHRPSREAYCAPPYKETDADSTKIV